MRILMEYKKPEKGLCLWYGNFLELLNEFRDFDDSIYLCDALNRLSNHDIAYVSLPALTYVCDGKIRSLLDMGTSEKAFLITLLCAKTNTPLTIVDYPDELTPKSSKLYLELFGNVDVTVCLKNPGSAFVVAARRVNLC